MARKHFAVTISGLAVAFAVLLFGGYALSEEAGMTTTSPNGNYSAGVNSPNGTNSDVSASLNASGLEAGESAMSSSFGMATSQYTENGPASSVNYGTLTASDNVENGAVNAEATATNINGYAYSQNVPGYEDTMGTLQSGDAQASVSIVNGADTRFAEASADLIASDGPVDYSMLIGHVGLNGSMEGSLNFAPFERPVFLNMFNTGQTFDYLAYAFGKAGAGNQ
jgi:hypothetical protein